MSSETSAAVQQEAEAERAVLVNTLDRLRENLKPANVVDEVMASAKISTAEISDRVWSIAMRNPIPAAIIGIGAAMLFGAGQKVRAGKAAKDHDWTDDSRFPDVQAKRIDRPALSAASTTPNLGENRSGFRSQPPSRVRSAGSKALNSAERFGDAAQTFGERSASSIRNNALSAQQGFDAVSGENTMSQYSRSRDQVAGTLSRLLEEQPLVLAALGVAVGAALGAAIPGTDAESRLMGDASETFRSRAQELAQTEYRHLKETASNTVSELKQAAADHGASAENFSGLVQDASAKVRDAANEVASHAAESAGVKS